MNIVKSLSLLIILLLLQINSHAAKIELTTADNLTAILKRKDDDKKVLLFFTSWCSYCKSAVQQIIDNKTEHKITFISLDKHYEQIKGFSSSMPENISIYYFMNQNEIVEFFNMHNIQYTGSIPYISILDGDNRLLQDNLSTRQLQRYIK